MEINRLLESLPLTTALNLLALLGVFLALYTMQATSHYYEDRGDPPMVQWAHRAILVLLALTFLWMLTYGRDKSWEPWPPMVALIVVIDAFLALRAVTVSLARKNLMPRQPLRIVNAPSARATATNRR